MGRPGWQGAEPGPGGLLRVILAAGLLAAACSTAPSWGHNQTVRRAALEHLGFPPVAELIVSRDEGEPRVRLTGPWQAVVWVTPGMREDEYFLTRSSQASYLYLGRISYEDGFGRARLAVRASYGPGQAEERILLLERRAAGWRVIGEERR